MVTRCITHQLEIVWRVLVVTRDVEGHHPLKEHLGSGMVTEKSIAVDVEQFTI